MIPADPDLAWRARMWDRIFDQYVHVPMQKIVTDAIRPDGGHDPHGVAEARAALAASYRFLEDRLPAAPWALGGFGLADCAAAPGALLRRRGAAPRPGRAAAQGLPRPPRPPPLLRGRARRRRALLPDVPPRPEAEAPRKELRPAPASTVRRKRLRRRLHTVRATYSSKRPVPSRSRS